MSLDNQDITNSPPPTPPSFTSGTESPPTAKVNMTPEAITIHMQSYVGYDTISTMGSIRENIPVYDASPTTPFLLEPDPEGQTGPQPYGAAERKVVKNFFSKQVQERLTKSGLSAEEIKAIHNALMTGQPFSDPKLAQVAKEIGKQVTALTREKAYLPENWTLQSTSSQEWTAQPIPPYNETERKNIGAFYETALAKALVDYTVQAKLSPPQVTQLQTAIDRGKVPYEIAEDFQAITEIARKETQKTYSLSSTWYPDTPNIDEWKPVNLSIVNPTAVSQARLELFIFNLTEYLGDLDKAASKTRVNLLTNDPNQIALADVIGIIAQAIRDLKQILRNMQLEDAKKTKDLQQMKLEMVQDREKRIEEDLEKTKEMNSKQAKQKKISLVMKIVGPIVAALSTIIGAALAIFTFGASTALIVAGIAVGIAMTTYSIVDSTTGVTQNLFAAFNNWLEKSFPDNPTSKTLVKFAIIGAVALVLAAAIFFSGGGAAANTTTQVASQVAKEAIKQLSIQFLVITIMSSNIIPELVSTILIESGAIDKDNKKGNQIVQMVVTGITMVTTMVAMVLFTRSSGSSVPGAAQTTAKEVETASNKLMDMTIKALETIKERAAGTAIELGKGLREIGRGYRDLAELLAELVVKLVERDFSSVIKMDPRLISAGMSLQKTLQISTLGIQAADGIFKGYFAVQVANLLKRIGETKASEELIQEAIKTLEKVLASLQNIMDSRGDWLISAQEDYNNLFATSNRITSKIFQVQG